MNRRPSAVRRDESTSSAVAGASRSAVSAREEETVTAAMQAPRLRTLIEREPCDMVTHMKTTVDIADDLLLRAKREAEASQTTLRSLIEEGLREVLGRKALSKQKSIKPVTFRGRGLQIGRAHV